MANDYAKLLNNGIWACRNVISKNLWSIQPKLLVQGDHLAFCDHLNVSSCAYTERLGEKDNDNQTVVVYNPLGHELQSHQLRIPVKSDGKFYEVTDDQGKTVPSSLVDIPEAIRHLPGRYSQAKQELVFNVGAPAVGFASYALKATAKKEEHSAAVTKGEKIVKAIELKGKGFTLKTDASGQVAGVKLDSGEEVSLESAFAFYKGHNGDNHNFDSRASGAYIFRPDGQGVTSAGKVKEAVHYKNADGSQEIHQTYDSSYIQQVVRVSPQKEAIEFEYLVGPIPVDDNVGKEVVARYTTNLNNNNTFWTDANGRQMLERKLNFRPTWKYQVNEPTAGNYYPVNSRIFIRDAKKGVQVTVLNDRSQGGTSPAAGSIELMVHRRLLHDDAFGVGEALNEPGEDGKGLIIRGRHLVVVSKIEKAASLHREIAQQLYAAPVVSFTKGQPITMQWTALTAPLPANIHLLTLETWSEGHFLLRLEHIYQVGEDSQLSKPQKINLGKLFYNHKITSVQEMTLSANQDKAALANRLTFKYTPVGKPIQPAPAPFDAKTLDVTLNPFQIRTFVVKF